MFNSKQENPITQEVSMDEKVQSIYSALNQSERFGLQFGMFPARLMGTINREESVMLMKYGKENRYA